MLGQDNVSFTDNQEALEVLAGQSKLLRYFNRPKQQPWLSQRYDEYYELNGFKNSDEEAPKHAQVSALDYTAEAASAGVVRKLVHPRKPPGVCSALL